MGYTFTSYITFLCRKIHTFTFDDLKYHTDVLYHVFVIAKHGTDWYKHECLFGAVFLQLIVSYYTNFNAI